ncbi:IS3 family transposase [Pelorhabdus rhamnosifermentans]
MKRELIHGAKFSNPEQAQQEIFKYIETYYNTNQIKSSLGYFSLA